jgi:AraC-like DNA-binding protein
MPEPISESVVARPVGPLRSVVGEHHGYRQRHVAPARHLGLPSPWLTVIFTLDERLHIASQVDPRRGPDEYDALVGGLHTRPALIEHPGAQSGIQIQLSPLGARAVLGLPAGELAGADGHASEVLGALAADLTDQLRAAPTWRQRFALLDRHLGARLIANDARPPAEVARAWRLLRASGGTASIAAVARAVGWSERHLGNRFRTAIGLTPKQAARVIRFDRARRMLPSVTGAEVAAACGYADQSHLVREFVAFSGLSPGGWLRAEFGNVQAFLRPDVEDWAS